MFKIEVVINQKGEVEKLKVILDPEMEIIILRPLILKELQRLVNTYSKEEIFNAFSQDNFLYTELMKNIMNIKHLSLLFPDHHSEILKHLLNNEERFSNCIKNIDDLKKLIAIFPQYEDIILKNIFENENKKNLLFTSMKALHDFTKSFKDYLDNAIKAVLSNNDRFRKCFPERNNIDSVFYFEQLFPNYLEEAFKVYISPINFDFYIKKPVDISNIRGSSSLQCFQESLLAGMLDFFNRHKANLQGSDFISPLIAFIQETTPLKYERADRFHLAYEAFQIVTQPHLISSEGSNLCGPAAFLTALITTNSKFCIEQFIMLLKTGKTAAPLYLSSNTTALREETHFGDILLNAIRHKNNLVMGYSSSPQQLESLRGITKPLEICKWLRLCGFSDIIEATIIRGSDKKELSTFRRGLFGGVYDSTHRNFSTPQESLKAAIDQANAGKVLILSFCQKREANFLGIIVDHYEFVKSISCDEKEDQITLTTWTYGNEVTSTTKTEEFLQKYAGFISAKPNLSNSPEKKAVLDSPPNFSNI